MAPQIQLTDSGSVVSSPQRWGRITFADIRHAPWAPITPKYGGTWQQCPSAVSTRHLRIRLQDRPCDWVGRHLMTQSRLFLVGRCQCVSAEHVTCMEISVVRYTRLDSLLNKQWDYCSVYSLVIAFHWPRANNNIQSGPEKIAQSLMHCHISNRLQ